MRLTVTIVLILFITQLKAQDTLHWSATNTLTWSDFKNEPDTSKRYLAITSTGISYSVHYSEDTFQYKIAAYFNRNRSWKKPSADDKTLRHEQGHFDITEIYARKLEAMLKRLNPGRDAVKKTMDKLSENINSEKNDYQKKYDTETVFGTNAVMQQKWEENIKTQLQQ